LKRGFTAFNYTFGYRLKLLGLFVLLAVSANLSLAQGIKEPQAVFDKGNDLLQSGKYTQALQRYKKIERAENVSGALFLNMGISYVNLDSLGLAKYYLMKAEQYPETRYLADKGIKYINERFSRQSAQLPKLPWDRALDWLRYHYEVSTVFIWGIILLNLGIIGIVGSWFLRKVSKPAKYSGIGLAGLGLVVILTSFFMNYLNHRYSRAVMVQQEASVTEKPQPKSALISKAYEGYTFTVDLKKSQNHQGWVYVRMSNGMYGWISKDEIKIL